MEALKLDKVIEKDGEINIKGIPCKKGERIELIILLDQDSEKKNVKMLHFDSVKLKTKDFHFNRDLANER